VLPGKVSVILETTVEVSVALETVVKVSVALCDLLDSSNDCQ